MGKKHPNVTHLNEAQSRKEQRGTRFGFISKKLGLPSGARMHGCSWYEVEPGRTAFPHHFHCANEEGIFILEGRGEMRIGEERVAVEQDEYIAFPVGPQSAHSLKNTGTAPLRYLCFSTMVTTEVVGYPDSKKIGAVGLADPHKGLMNAPVKMFVKEQPFVDYYEGEDVG